MMIGRVDGHEEPEWNERTCWDELNNAVYWEGRPATMTDAEWERCQRIARTQPVTDEQLESMMEWPEESETVTRVVKGYRDVRGAEWIEVRTL